MCNRFTFPFRLFEVVETLSRVHLVMDYAPYGELYNQIMTEGALPENEARLGFFQLVSAVEYMVSHLVSVNYKVTFISFVS